MIISDFSNRVKRRSLPLTVFLDKENRPSKGDLEKMPAETYPVWNQILVHLSATYPQITEKWQFGKQSGWTLRVISKKRTVV